MKNVPEDYPFSIVPMGMSWTKKNGWIVRRGDRYKREERTFRSFDDALIYCNELYSDKRPPFTHEMLMGHHDTNTFPQEAYQGTLSNISENLTELREAVEQVTDMLQKNNDYLRTLLFHMQEDRR